MTISSRISPNMFATCLAALLDSRTGRLQYANAGHDPPYVRRAAGVSKLGLPACPRLDAQHELRAERDHSQPGENMLLYSDGLAEAHSPQREMFGFPRMQGHIVAHPEGASLIDSLLAELERFTGEDWEQEDDITLTDTPETSILVPWGVVSANCRSQSDLRR